MNGERPLVVAADDEEDILALICTVLRNGGFEVVPARDGVEALAAIGEHSPQAVLLDVAMPKVDGLEVLKRLRADPATADLPVVVLSARAQERDVADGYERGASTYVRKPFKPAKLLAVLRELVG